MLTILPEKDTDYARSVLLPLEEGGVFADLLVAREGQAWYGSICVCAEEHALRLLKIELPKDLSEEETLFYADALLRSAASYAINRCLFQMDCVEQSCFPILHRFGFEQIHDKMAIEINRLIKKCKNC
jgi:hypothetical protein